LKSQHERDVLEAIENLCNTVIANAASRTLAKLKSRADAKQIFSSVLLFHRALHAMSTRRYRFPVRRYIIELFDIKLDENILAELARHEREAQEELMSVGGLLLNQRSSHSHGHGHHSHGSRRLRHSMRAKTRRRSNAEFRTVGGQEEDGGQLNGSGLPDSPVIVVRAKADIQRVSGFDAPMDDGLANAMIMQLT
jgi:rapamycin-insensitive companion of mTOR